MATERSYSQNLIANFLGNIILALVMLVGTPLLIRTMGSDSYAIWRILVYTIVSYIALLDFGMRSAVKRYLGDSINRNDFTLANTVGNSIFFVYFIFGLVGASIMLSGIYWIPKIVNIPLEYLNGFYALNAAVCILVMLLFISSIYSAIFEIYARYDIAQILLVVGRILSIFSIPAIIYFGGIKPLYAAAIATAVFPILMFILRWRSAKYICPRYAPRLSMPNTAIIGGMFSFGIFGFLNTFGSLLTNQSQPIIIGQLLSLGDVTIYAVIYVIISELNAITASATAPFFPIISKISNTDKTKLPQYFNSAIVLCFYIVMIFAIPLIIMSGTFFKYWIADEFYSANSVLWFMIPLIATLPFSYISAQFMIAAGDIKPLGIYSVISGASSILFSYAFVLCTNLGLRAIALAASIPAFVFSIACFIRTAREMKASPWAAFAVYPRSIPVVLIDIGAMEALFAAHVPTNLFEAMAYLAILAAVTAVCGVLFMFDAESKLRAKEVFTPKLKAILNALKKSVFRR